MTPKAGDDLVLLSLEVIPIGEVSLLHQDGSHDLLERRRPERQFLAQGAEGRTCRPPASRRIAGSIAFRRSNWALISSPISR